MGYLVRTARPGYVFPPDAFGCTGLIVLQVTRADFRDASKLIRSRTRDNMYSSLGASDPFSALIKSECDVGRIEFLPASLPRTMTTAKHRMRVSAPKESPI